VLELVDDAPEPTIGDGMALLDVARAGINFADTHQAEDTYLAPTTLPFVPGGGGRAVDGRRVVALLPGGGYAERAAAPSATTFDVPDGVDDGTACALVLQGTTAWHVLRTSARIQPGETVVVMAAAGGVGTLAVQLARTFGAGRVVAVASSPEKRALALGARCGRDGRQRRGGPHRRDPRGVRRPQRRRARDDGWARRPRRASRRSHRSAGSSSTAWRRASRPHRSTSAADGPLAGRHRVLARARDARPGTPARRADGRAARPRRAR
jgi:hypothetical protein